MSFIRQQHLIDALVIGSIIKTADGGLLSSLAEGVKSYVKSLWNPNEPISSVVAFLGPGLLLRAGFPILGIFYEVAEALGFDWIGFWNTVGTDIEQLLKTVSEGKSSQDFSEHIDGIVQNAANQHFQDDPDTSKLYTLMKNPAVKESLKTTAKQDIRNALELKAFAIQYKNDKTIIKNAGIFSFLTKKLSKFFIRAISFLIRTALYSLGFAVAGGVIHQPIDAAKQYFEGDHENNAPELPNKPVPIPLSPSVSQDLLTWHQNDIHGVWIERGDISSLRNTLMSWVLSAYPQLQKNSSDLQSSNAFMAVLNQFMTRNSMNTGSGIISFPHQYQRKLDIVNQIVGGFLSEHPNNSSPNTDKDKETVIDYK